MAEQLDACNQFPAFISTLYVDGTTVASARQKIPFTGELAQLEGEKVVVIYERNKVGGSGVYFREDPIETPAGEFVAREVIKNPSKVQTWRDNQDPANLLHYHLFLGFPPAPESVNFSTDVVSRVSRDNRYKFLSLFFNDWPVAVVSPHNLEIQFDSEVVARINKEKFEALKRIDRQVIEFGVPARIGLENNINLGILDFPVEIIQRNVAMFYLGIRFRTLKLEEIDQYIRQRLVEGNLDYSCTRKLFELYVSLR